MRGLPADISALYTFVLRRTEVRSAEQRALVCAIANLAYTSLEAAAVAAWNSCCDRCDVLCAADTHLLFDILADEIVRRSKEGRG